MPSKIQGRYFEGMMDDLRNLPDGRELELPGDYAFGEWDTERKLYQLVYMCPCGNTTHHRGSQALIIIDGAKQAPNDHIWQWDGNKELPTLSPSIRDTGCGWHGFLVKGEWQPCDDSK